MTNFTTLNFLGVLTNEIWERLLYTANVFRVHGELYVIVHIKVNVFSSKYINKFLNYKLFSFGKICFKMLFFKVHCCQLLAQKLIF